jgi:hypothetical protein
MIVSVKANEMNVPGESHLYRWKLNKCKNKSKNIGKLSGSGSSYLDTIYIVKDIIMKLVEHNELTQATPLSFCGLNLKKSRSILDELESN